MATGLSESLIAPERADGNLPYPAGPVDRFLAWVDRLRIPTWFFYLALLTALVFIFNGLAWIDGSLRFPALDVYRSSVPVYPVASLALVHYLNRAAHRALAAFSPALGAAEEKHEQLEYMLVTLPRRGTWVTLTLSIAFTAVYINFTPYIVDLFRRSPWVAVTESVVCAFAFGMVAVFLYHTIHQLRMVSLIHARATDVNLFRLTPLYAFSGLTAQTGIGILLMNYFGVLTDPATFENVALITLTVTASIIAVVCFVLPLQGMHARIVAEKKRLLIEANTRLEDTIQRLYACSDSQDLAEVGHLNQLMVSLVTTLEIVERISTWPWKRETFASFITVFLLPLVVRLIVGLIALLVP